MIQLEILWTTILCNLCQKKNDKNKIKGSGGHYDFSTDYIKLPVEEKEKTFHSQIFDKSKNNPKNIKSIQKFARSTNIQIGNWIIHIKVEIHHMCIKVKYVNMYW